MVHATSCPSVPDLQRLLLGQSAEEESVSLEAHLLHCEKCLQSIRTLPPDDALLSALQQGSESATPAPSSGLLDKVRRQLLEMRRPSAGMDLPNTGETAGAAPSPMDATQGVGVPLAPPQSPDEIGRLGGYRILKELGRGGMGVVYQAEDPKLKRLVALKAMLPRLAADMSARQRFIREAQAMAAVHHDHIVTIFQVDEANGVPFLAMEFLQGMPLDQWLKGGRKATTAQVLRMGREIAEGLAAAHERGLIHRDVKPGNIWLDSDHKGRVKILDFGLARVGADDVHLTRSGAIVGTPAYMSPEQARGEKVDGRCDLFSLGCVLFKLCTGTMPFAGDTTMGLLMSLALDQPKSVRELNLQTPPELSDLVMKLLEKDPARRPASARAVVEVVQNLEKQFARKQEGDAPTATHSVAPLALTAPIAVPRPAARRRRLALVAAGLLVLGGIIAAGAAALIHIQTPQGDYVIDTDDPAFFFQVHDGAVHLQDRKNNKNYTLKVVKPDRGGGESEVEVSDGGDLAFRTKRFTIKRGETAALTAWFEPKGVAANAQPAKLDDAWLKQVAAMPANRQLVAVVAELMARNPGFDGKVTPNVQNGVVTALLFLTDDVTDISPVRALLGLRTLHCSAAYQGKGRLADLSPLKGMELTQLECQGTLASDLSPLKDIPLVWLACSDTAVKDLSPLKGMPLTLLDCHNTSVSDLSPLRGMPLKVLTCDVKPERDAEILHSIKTLETINGKPVAEFWKEVDGKRYPSPNDAWVKEVAALFPKQQMDAVVAELKKRNPDFDGQLDYKTKDGVVVEVRLAADYVADISPLRAMTGLQVLHCGSIGSASPLADLSPLKGMKLTELDFPHTQVSDLSPLKGMPLTSLACSGGRVADLSPLKGAPLTTLDVGNNRAVSDLAPLHGAPLTTLLFGNTNVEDLSPLKGMALTHLEFHGTAVRDVTPLAGMPLTEVVCGGSFGLSWLRGMKLTSLDCNRMHVSDLSPLKDMKLTTLICFGTQVSDLSPLKGMPLTNLYCANTMVSDLTPLRGMPLTALNIPNTPVSDLSPLTGMKLELLDVDHTPVSDLLPLKGMPLRQLQFTATKVSDLSPLRDMPLQFLVCDCKAGRDAEVLHSIKTLQTINFKPTAEFLKEVDAKSFPPLDEAWVQKVADLSLEKQVEEVAVELKRRNPGFDGKMESFFEHNAVKALTLKTDDLADLTPLRAFPRLKWLGVYGIDRAKCRLADLTPLKGMQLTRLDLQDMVLSDLAPLKGMPLTYLKCNNTRVSDLSPLKGTPLTELNCNNTRVSDLSPLKDMKLTTLRCGATQVADLSALHGMPLTSLECGKLPISDLLPLKDMKLTYLNFADTAITDLSPLKGMPLTYLEAQGTPPIISLLPLKGMPLTYLNATIQPKRDAEILRSLKTLQTINGKPAAEFWKEVDAKTTEKKP